MTSPSNDDLDEFGLGFDHRSAAAQPQGDVLRDLDPALRGMTAQQSLANLRDALSKGRLAGPPPLSKTLRSPYRDSTQMAVVCTGTFTPADWSNSVSPQMRGTARVHLPFKPQKLILSEALTVTFVNASGKKIEKTIAVADAGDLVLSDIFHGSTQWFPNRPMHGYGISGRSLSANSLGSGISCPSVSGGVDLTASISVEQTALYRVPPPKGYASSDIASIRVEARLHLFGVELRPSKDPALTAGASRRRL